MFGKRRYIKFEEHKEKVLELADEIDRLERTNLRLKATNAKLEVENKKIKKLDARIGKDGLKPCPFCGGLVRITAVGTEKNQFFKISRGWGKGRCKCEVFLASEHFDPETVTDEEKAEIKIELIDRWNRRA